MNKLLLISLIFFISTAESRIKSPYNNSIKRLDFMSQIRNYGDVIRTDEQKLERAQEYLNSKELTEITAEFGPSVITAKEFPFRSKVAQSKIKPWSSWWYPKREDTLFTSQEAGRLSTLGKYDFVRKKWAEAKGITIKPEEAAETFERNQYNPNSLPWEGLCDAWAIASIVMPEPKRPIKITVSGDSENPNQQINVNFNIIDLKALLLKTFDAIDESNLKIYGQKFTGKHDSWIYPDLFPEQFHRFIEVQLFEKQKPFIMDHDPGIEVWNVPVYKANYLMEEVPGNPDAVSVRAWLYSAEAPFANDKNFVGTKEAVREYNYILEGKRNEDGDLVVTSGYWIKGPNGIDSRQNHPDYFIEILTPSSIQRKSWNPEIDPLIVDEILSGSY